MSEELSPQKKLQKDLATVAWSYIQPHYERDVVWLLNEKFDMIETALAIVEDQSEKVEDLVKDGNLLKPSKAITQFWNKEKLEFRVIIVKPFVLIQGPV